jgi:hypothetical protein
LLAPRSNTTIIAATLFVSMVRPKGQKSTQKQVVRTGAR